MHNAQICTSTYNLHEKEMCAKGDDDFSAKGVYVNGDERSIAHILYNTLQGLFGEMDICFEGILYLTYVMMFSPSIFRNRFAE
jgi:hypothetical protein